MARVRHRIDVVHEPALTAEQRLVLEPRHRAPDPCLLPARDGHELFLPCFERGCTATGSSDGCTGSARDRERLWNAGAACELDQQRGRERVTCSGCIDVRVGRRRIRRRSISPSQAATAPSPPSVTHASRRPWASCCTASWARAPVICRARASFASNTSGLSITEIAGRRRSDPQGRRLPLLLARVPTAADRGHRGRGHVGGDRSGRASTFAQQIRKMAIRSGRVSRLRGQPDPRLDGLGGVALPGRERGSTSSSSTSSSKGRHRCRWARSGSPTCPAWTPSVKVAARHARRLRRPLLRPQGHGGAGQSAATSAPRPGRGFISTAEEPKLDAAITRSASSSRRSSRRASCSRRASPGCARSTSG